ncbi:MAG: serine dehydratase beta chain, partial [Pseudomonas sp.]
MAISVFDLFKVGIGPSSSHTVGPMRAAALFTHALENHGHMPQVTRVAAELYGSLGATGKGHGSDKAVLLGLSGYEPDTVDVDQVPGYIEAIRRDKRIVLAGKHSVAFDEKADLKMFRKALPLHANGLRFAAFDAAGIQVHEATYYSVGGGFVVSEAILADGSKHKVIAPDATSLPLPFSSGADLLRLARENGIGIAEVMRRNERHWRSDEETDAGLLEIWKVMQACVDRGCRTEGILPGGFKVRRRAAILARKLGGFQRSYLEDPLRMLDWVNLWALAVNEENAAG